MLRLCTASRKPCGSCTLNIARIFKPHHTTVKTRVHLSMHVYLLPPTLNNKSPLWLKLATRVAKTCVGYLFCLDCCQQISWSQWTYGDLHKFGNKGSDKKWSLFSKKFIKEHERDSGVGTALINLCIPYLWKPLYVLVGDYTREIIFWSWWVWSGQIFRRSRIDKPLQEKWYALTKLWNNPQFILWKPCIRNTFSLNCNKTVLEKTIHPVKKCYKQSFFNFAIVYI